MDFTKTQDVLQSPGAFSFDSDDAHIHKLMRWLAVHYASRVLVSYPNTDGDYNVNLTGADMERVTAYTASKYSEAFRRFPNGEVTGDLGFGGLDTKVIAVINVSTLSSYMTYVALHRLGFTPMFVSPRLAEPGYTHLLRTTGCHCVIAGGPSLGMIHGIKKTYDRPLDVVPILEDEQVLEGLTSAKVDLPDPGCSPGEIIHTGGTTGLPRPVRFNLRTWMARLPLSWTSTEEKILCTLPIFHTYGLGTFTRSMRIATPICLLNPHRPVTASIVWRALDVTGAKHLYTVPYVLKFFTDMDGGVQRLAKLDTVRPGGSALPDDIGDELIKNGINLSFVYGQTESGVTMLQAGRGLGEWNWLTPMEFAEKFMLFEKVGDGLYHLRLLAGLDGLKVSDHPDGSYGTKDLFRPHPDNLPGNDTRAGLAKWKFMARQGDIIVLVNGENADPTPIEQAVMSEPTVQMTVAFGAGHERLGLLIIPSEKAAGMTKDEVIKSVLPALERGNKLAANYAKIAPDDIIVKPVGTQYPQTAKMTLQRPVLNQLFADDIEAHYASRETVAETATMSDEDVRGVVRRVVQQEFQDRLAASKSGETNGAADHNDFQMDDGADFFALGMDSLQSSLVRRRLLRQIPLPGEQRMATNVVFEYPSVKLLSEHILLLRQKGSIPESTIEREPETVAKSMVEKYRDLIESADVQSPSVSVSSPAKENGVQGHVIVLTGATGYIGAQLLSTLLNRPDVSMVYCLVRTRQKGDHKGATERVHTALANSNLLMDLGKASLSKLRCLSSNLAALQLGLLPTEYSEVKANMTAVMHNAWSVNFNMSLESFEPNVASVAHLLVLARGNPDQHKTRTFVFISSIAAVGGALNGRNAVREGLCDWQAAKPRNGYGQSKWVAEQICAAASGSQHDSLGSVRVLRIGQVSGDTKHGIWNPAEAIPAMVQSALTIGALPLMDDEKRNVHRWLPSDIAATAITDLTLADPERHPKHLAVFHVASPRVLRWNEDVLPAVEKAGISFRVVPQREWVQILNDSDSDIARNPPYKLVEHFRQVYGGVRDETQVNGFRQEGRDELNGDMGLCRLDLTTSFECSPALRSASPVDSDLLVKYVRFWKQYWAEKASPSVGCR